MHDSNRLRAVFNALEGVTAVPNKPDTWAFHCKVCGKPSNVRKGRVWLGRSGKIVIGCYACETHNNPAARLAVVTSLGLQWRDLMPSDDKRPPRHIEPAYIFTYVDAAGRPRHRKLRFEWQGTKWFRQEMWDGRAWQRTMENVECQWYRLPDLLARPRELVTIHEGELKADCVAQLGILGTCLAGGSNSILYDYYAPVLRGRDVAIFPDNDAPGTAYADRLIGFLSRAGTASIRLVALPRLPQGGDVVDWRKATPLTAPAARATLLRFIAQAPVYRRSGYDKVE